MKTPLSFVSKLLGRTPKPKLYPVTTTLSSFWQPTDQSQIVFHGINKSGSLALAKVLKVGYDDARREDEFYSHYHRRPYSLEELISLAQTVPGRGFFVGHDLFGALQPAPHRLWFSQFRHPLPRIVSCYSWLRNEHQAKGEAFPSLEEFVIAGRGRGHSQFAQLGIGYGPDAAQRKKGKTTKDIFEAAKEALANDLYAVGIAEYFEETIFLVARLCELSQVPAWRRDKRNPTRTLATDLPDHLVNLIREVYAYEFEFYEFALQRFFEQNKKIDFGSGLDAYKEVCASQYKDRLLHTTEG